MKHIGTYMDRNKLDAMIERLTNDLERQRQAGIQDFGWPDDCECHECGDSGINPRNNSVCWCDTGRKIQLRKEREAEWPTYAPHIHVNARLETHPSDMARAIGQQWLDRDFPNNRGMVISGSVGRGKTGLAVALAYIVHMQGHRVRIGTFTEILDEMRPKAGNSDKETEPADMYKPKLLVLDDLGTQKMTEFVEERLFAIIDGRHQRTLPTIITTNLGLPELKKQFGDRVVSRIVEVNAFESLAGTDMRMRRLTGKW